MKGQHILVYLIPLGSVFAAIGAVILVISALVALSAKKRDKNEDDMKVLLSRLIVWHAGALALAGLGLMVVIVGAVLT